MEQCSTVYCAGHFGPSRAIPGIGKIDRDRLGLLLITRNWSARVHIVLRSRRRFVVSLFLRTVRLPSYFSTAFLQFLRLPTYQIFLLENINIFPDL